MTGAPSSGCVSCTPSSPRRRAPVESAARRAASLHTFAPVNQAVDAFEYLMYGVAFVLAFIGLKLLGSFAGVEARAAAAAAAAAAARA